MDFGLKSATLGSSILVPSVKELVKEPLTAVPPRYVRPDDDDDDQDAPLIPVNDHLPQVPLIDMEILVCGPQDLKDLELQKLHKACQEWGIFQLINHRVDASLVEKMKTEVQELFDLPMEDKKILWQEPGEIQGFGQAFVKSEEQKLEWADLFFLVTLPPHSRKHHLFDRLPISFREALEAYSKEVEILTMKILTLMTKALNMDLHDMKALFEGGYQATRMNYYPPCPQPELVIGLNPHTDGNGLTVLLQVNATEGLQGKKDGMWVPIKPLPDAFVVNVGDILEILSNGTYHSVEHRAVVNSAKERLSIAAFYSPKLDGDLGPAPSLITPESPPKYRTMTVADYKKEYHSRAPSGRSHLDGLRI